MLLWVPLSRSGSEPHAAMALESPDSDGRLRVIGCSTKTYSPEKLVELPSDSDRPNGHPRTKLKRRTFAVADWIEDISVSDVCEIKGIVPPTTIDRIWDKIRKYSPATSKPN